MVEVLKIPAAMAREVWDQAGPLLAEPVRLTDGRFELEDALHFCTQADAQLWLMTDDNKVLAAAVTEIVNYPRKRVTRVLFVGGSGVEKWHVAFGEALEAWGRSFGCSGDEAGGRKGWVRLVGAREVATLFSRDYGQVH